MQNTEGENEILNLLRETASNMHDAFKIRMSNKGIVINDHVNPETINSFNDLIGLAIDIELGLSKGLASQLSNHLIEASSGHEDSIKVICYVLKHICDFVITMDSKREYFNMYGSLEDFRDSVLQEIFKVLKENNNSLTANFHKENINISCRIGCSHCCHINLDINNIEAEHILNSVELSDQQKELIKHQANVMSRLKNTNDAYKVLREEGKSGCVFLKDNKCSIYDIRPFACRTHMSINDPEDCNSFIDDKEIGIPVHTENEVIKTAFYYFLEPQPISVTLSKLI